MAVARAYKIGVFDTSTWLPTGATVTTTSTTPILFISTSANSDLNISAIRCGVLGAASFPSNASIVFSINTVTGTKAGGNAVTPLQLSGIAKASLVTAVATAGGRGGGGDHGPHRHYVVVVAAGAVHRRRELGRMGHAHVRGQPARVGAVRVVRDRIIGGDGHHVHRRARVHRVIHGLANLG